jgi:DNA topoisomerase-1
MSSEASIAALQAARDAGLKWVSDTTPGIHRKRKGSGFVYAYADGKAVRDLDQLQRIKSLVIPPAWKDVWICADEYGHIQATGKDDRGRKQYRYHPKWREVRDSNKYHRMIDFGKALPKIRKRLNADLRKPGLPREKVLAAVVKLMETTLIRVGNDEYAKENHSYGLTTMRDRHAHVNGNKVHFSFRGKSGVEHDIDLSDKRLAKIVKACRELPGQELFQFLDHDGNVHDISSTDVNEYLHEIAGDEFTAKDFRTWAGTVLAAMALQEFEKFTSQRQAKRYIVSAIESVAKKLGNTKAVCRKCYIHPEIFNAYMDGTLVQTLKNRVEKKLSGPMKDLRPAEAAVLVLLQQRLSREAARSNGANGSNGSNGHHAKELSKLPETWRKTVRSRVKSAA